jgi:hypothetical protein
MLLEGLASAKLDRQAKELEKQLKVPNSSIFTHDKILAF